MRASGAACVALLLVALPSAALAQEDADALCIIFVRPSADFGTVEVTADLILNPDQRENLSARIDADDDGFVSAAEVEAYENETTLSYDGATIPSERRIALDDWQPDNLTVYTRLRNWTGPREEAEQGIVTESRYYRFTPVPGDVHRLTGHLYVRPAPTSQVVIEVVVIEAPRGWNVTKLAQADENGNEHNTSFPNERSVRLSGFDLARGVVEFRNGTAAPTTQPPPPPPSPPGRTPGTLVALALLGAAAVAVGARRRARQ